MNNDEALAVPTDGCKLNVKLGVLLDVLAMKLKPALDAWVKG